MVLMCGLQAGLQAQMDPLLTDAVTFADSQMRNTLSQIGYSGDGVNPDWAVSAPHFPKVTDSDTGEVQWGYQSRTGNWGAGFTPGLMWDLYDLTGDGYWQRKARAFTDGIEPNKTAGGDMQMNIGFHFMNSYARRIAHDGMAAADLGVMQTAANHLATNSWMDAVGSLWSFSWGTGEKSGGLRGDWSAYKNTIIDSAPNLEILFHQAKVDSDLVMWYKAVSHMGNLVRDNIRADGSTAQLVSYNTTTGEFIRTCGHQGYSYFSTWSRGQGWGMHGFASAWRETRDPAMGEAFHQLYSFYRDNCPVDGVPYWDFMAPDLTDEELDFRYPDAGAPALRFGRDSSAAALAASSLMLACRLADSEALRKEYFEYGLHILKSLASAGYLAIDEFGDPTKESILGQGTYTFPGIGKGQIWGDFFFVEALRRYRELVEPESVFDTDFDFGNLGNYTVLESHLWSVTMDQGDPALRMHGRPEISSEVPADFALFRHAVVGDFELSFVFRADENLALPGPVHAVFVFGYVDGDNFRFVRLGSEPGSSGIFLLTDGVLSQLAAPVGNWSGQGYHQVAIERANDALTIRVDESSWGTFEDPGILGSGGIGFGGMGHSLFFDAIQLSGAISPFEFSPYMVWKATHFTEPLGMAAMDYMDADRDGRPVLMEYAMGSDPNLPDVSSGGLGLASPAPGSLQLSFRHNGQYNDLLYQLVETLDGGQTWTEIDRVMPSGTGGWANSTFNPDVPTSGAALYRLQVIRRR